MTQFTQPGWRFLDGGSGYLGADRTNGSYVSLRSSDGGEYSTIVETTTATVASMVTFNVSGNLSSKELHVWGTDLNSTSDKDQFSHKADLHPDGTGHYQFTLSSRLCVHLQHIEDVGKGN